MPGNSTHQATTGNDHKHTSSQLVNAQPSKQQQYEHPSLGHWPLPELQEASSIGVTIHAQGTFCIPQTPRLHNLGLVSPQLGKKSPWNKQMGGKKNWNTDDIAAFFLKPEGTNNKRPCIICK